MAKQIGYRKPGSGKPRRNQHLMTQYRMKELGEFSPVLHVALWNKYGDHPEDNVGWSRVQYLDDGDFTVPKYVEAKVVKRFQKKGYPPKDVCPDCQKEYRWHGWIPDEERTEFHEILLKEFGEAVQDGELFGHKVCPGDYILRQGYSYWPCHPDLFQQLYEKVQ